MRRLAEDLYLLHGFPPNVFNVYLMGGVLVDAATRHAGRRILRQLKGRTVTAHAVTHAHPDHQGASHRVCQALNLPLWCGEADADAVEDPRLILHRMPDHWINRTFASWWLGPPHPVSLALREGDEVGGFTVLDVPGHSAGHIAFWRESDRTLVLGDVLSNLNYFTGLPHLHEPPAVFTPDPPLTRRSARKLAALEPSLICFGHGPPMRDTKRFVEFVAKLSD